ncbi:MAG: hypothetical protein WBW24_22625, partial [Candidatus Sulfotelmatobacter sp.]
MLFITEKQPTSIAIGWSDPVCGREFHPLKSSAVHGALFHELSTLEEPGRAVSGVKGVRACQECLIRVQSYTASEKLMIALRRLQIDDLNAV